MKIKRIFLVVFSIISILLLESCDTKEISPLNDPNDQNNASIEAPTDPTKSRIQFKLVDAPDDNYLQVWVDIIDFQYQRSDASGWVSFDGYPLTTGENMVDLTELIAGTSHVLSDEELEPGLFSKVRIVLGDNNYLMIAGEESDEMIRKDLKTPSAQQSGLKIHVDTNLEAGYSYTFVLDWDVQKSIVKAGKSGNYNLKPVIRAHTEINAGDISGTVAEEIEGSDVLLEGVLVEVFESSDTEMTASVTSTITDVSGTFLVSTLPIGTYNLKFTFSSTEYVYDDEMKMGVGVNKDEITDVGIIYMKKSTGSLSGRVADSNETDDDPMPIGAATVNVYAVSDEDFSTILATTTTSDEGDFNFLELLPGAYILKALMTSYDEGLTETIEVVINTENEAGTILLTKSVGSISGRIADVSEAVDDLKPLEGATIHAYAKDDEDFLDSLGTASSSSEGTFTIPNLILGEYILKATLATFDEGQSGIIGVTESGGIYDAGTINLTLTTS